MESVRQTTRASSLDRAEAVRAEAKATWEAANPGEYLNDQTEQIKREAEAAAEAALDAA